MANTWLSLNNRRIKKVLHDIEALKLRGFDGDINLNEIKNLLIMMENEIKNLNQDLELARDENERLLKLFTEDDKD